MIIDAGLLQAFYKQATCQEKTYFVCSLFQAILINEAELQQLAYVSDYEFMHRNHAYLQGSVKRTTIDTSRL